MARRPELVRGAVVHEPALIALAGEAEAGDVDLQPIVELAAVDPRRAMEAFVRTNTSDATFEALDPRLRERMLANGEHFFSQELMAFGGYVPDAERIRATRVPVRLLVGRDGAPQLVRATARFADQLGLTVEPISGHHAPYLQQPEAFAEELRPILKAALRTARQRVSPPARRLHPPRGGAHGWRPMTNFRSPVAVTTASTAIASVMVDRVGGEQVACSTSCAGRPL